MIHCAPTSKPEKPAGAASAVEHALQSGNNSLKEVCGLHARRGTQSDQRENGSGGSLSRQCRDGDIASLVGEAQDKIAEQVRIPRDIGPPGAVSSRTRARGGSDSSWSCRMLLLIFILPSYRAWFGARCAALYSARPLALTGCIVALWLRDMPFSFSRRSRIHSPFGVAVLNGLVMLTNVNQLVSSGHSPLDAIREGAMTGFGRCDDSAGRLARLRTDGDAMAPVPGPKALTVLL